MSGWITLALVLAIYAGVAAGYAHTNVQSFKMWREVQARNPPTSLSEKAQWRIWVASAILTSLSWPYFAGGLLALSVIYPKTDGE